jgi:hypothetical protein
MKYLNILLLICVSFVYIFDGLSEILGEVGEGVDVELLYLLDGLFIHNLIKFYNCCLPVLLHLKLCYL